MTADDAIPSLLLPLTGLELMLPNAAVAEIVPYAVSTLVPHAPPWCHGLMQWRARMLPVVDVQAIEQPGEATEPPRARVAVLNRTDDSPTQGPYAVALSGAPRLVHVTREELKLDESQGAPGMTVRAHWRQSPVAIPDLDQLQALLREAGLSRFLLAANRPTGIAAD